MTPLLFGAVGGLGAGGILLLVSHIAPRLGASIPLRDLDQVCILGRDCSRREAHLVGILLHLTLSLVFGALFTLGVQEGMVGGYHLLPLLVYGLLLTVFMGGVVLPLEGHGLFGTKEDGWFPVDLLLTNVAWAFLYGLFMAVIA